MRPQFFFLFVCQTQVAQGVENTLQLNFSPLNAEKLGNVLHWEALKSRDGASISSLVHMLRKGDARG